MTIPCYWGTTELHITDCKDCYVKLACAKAEQFEKVTIEVTDNT